ncbi:MAG: glycosyltransferase [Clostridium sp.]|uniref:glycosyltransferase n=1 Tax=Clostridium sp. TaxID=1506 RepID=UPI003F359178
MNKKLAILSFSNPFVKEKDGGKIDIKNRIECLSKLNINIDHYGMLKKNENIEKTKLVSNNYSFKIVNSLKNIFKLDPISVSNRYNDSLATKLKSINYDYILLENFNMINYLKDVNSNNTFLRVHNIESISRKELFKSNPLNLRSILELIESYKYKRIEKKAIKEVDKFLFISLDEKNIFEKKYPQYSSKFYWLPTAIDIKHTKNQFYCTKDYILYYGDLSVSHNIQGLLRYVDKIYPTIKEKYPEIKLKIIGKISNFDRERLEKIKGIDILGYVDDLEKYIYESLFIIAPIYTGAGVKIKVINTISYNKLLITTPKGIEGTGLKRGENVLSAETDTDFINLSIKCLENNKQISDIPQKSLEFIQKFYSYEVQIERLKEILNL